MAWIKEQWIRVNDKDSQKKLDDAINSIEYYVNTYGVKKERLLDLLTVAKRMATHYNEYPVDDTINYNAYVVGIGHSNLEFTASINYNREWWTGGIGEVKYDAKTDTISVHVTKLHKPLQYVPYKKPIDNTELMK